MPAMHSDDLTPEQAVIVDAVSTTRECGAATLVLPVLQLPRLNARRRGYGRLRPRRICADWPRRAVLALSPAPIASMAGGLRVLLGCRGA